MAALRGCFKNEARLLAAVALDPLALELARAANRGGLLAGALLGRLLVVTAQLHLAVHALALQLLLERAQGLVDVVVANDDLHKPPVPLFIVAGVSGGFPAPEARINCK